MKDQPKHGEDSDRNKPVYKLDKVQSIGIGIALVSA